MKALQKSTRWFRNEAIGTDFTFDFDIEIYVSLNGDIEDNPDLVNDDAYADGWCVIVQPHEFDPDQFLDEHEYIEYLNEV